LITLISLNGTPLDLSTVEYEVQIQHGRSDVTAAPQPSNSQIIIRGPVGVQVEISDTVEIKAYGFHRFTGQVTDITLTHLSSVPPVAVSTITSIGELSRVGFTEVGASGWSEETVSTRVDDVLTTVGLPYLNGADTVTVLHQISSGNADPTDALSYLAYLAETTGATYYDDPYGRIVFESYGMRGSTSFSGAWANVFGDYDDNTVTWSSFPVNQIPTNIPGTDIIFTPNWTRTRQTVLNSVTVLGHNDSHETTQTDAGSIATYGLREYRLNTDIKSAGDVSDRAEAIITAQAIPFWNLGSISILVHNLGTVDRDLVLELVSGMGVTLENLPQPAPETYYFGIVEGWGEVYTPEQHILTLSLSDPRYSLATIPWDDVDGALEWGDVPAALKWFETITSRDLAA
jgi:hypothetical protein